VIDDEGINLGVMSLQDALKLSLERDLDLIEISPNATPPVARVMDFGKYMYQKEKEERQAHKKAKETELKGVRIGLNTSLHDMQMKAEKAEEFMKGANRVKVDFILKGRAKYLDKKFINERLQTFLSLLTVEYKIVSEPKQGPRGLSLVIEQQK
jgi:translation initiation factor IF-3